MIKTYAAYLNSPIRINSSSGGLFSVIASCFDVVYGVAMTDDCYDCRFIRTTNDITSLQGSKYFQAEVGDTFKQVKKDLIEGKKVLFSGTGCQINGLYMYLGKEYNNLFLLDIICHGVPSQKLWKKYVDYNEKKFGKYININFRCKENGWHNFGMKSNNNFISMKKDSFMYMFLHDYCLRPSCYQCKAKKYRKSDITLGDFWGIEKIAPEMDDDKGTSIVITRTNKGDNLFKQIKNRLIWKEVPYNEAVKRNQNEYKSVSRPKERDSFYFDLEKIGFIKTKNKYVPSNKLVLLKRIIKTVKNNIRLLLKR